MADSAPRAHGRAAFTFIFITVALDMLALGVCAPVLPKLVIQFKGGDLAEAADINGWFGLAFASMQFLFAPLVGALSDRFGRRPLVLLSNLGLGADYLVMAVAPSLSWLFAGRMISGLTAASWPLGSAYIADITPPEDRAKKFGMLAAAFGLGFVIGPGVGGLLGAIDLRLPFWVSAGLSLANFAYGLFVLPESLPLDRRSKVDLSRANPVGALRLLGSHPELLGLAVASFLYYLAHVALPATFVLYTTWRYGWTESTTGLSLAAVGVASTIVGAVLVGPLVSRLGDRRALFLGLCASMAGFLTFALASTTAAFMGGIPLNAMLGLVGPTSQSLTSRRVGPSEQGALQGALGSLRGITEMLGPVLFSGALAWSVRTRAAAPFNGAPFLLGGGMLALSAVISWRATAGARETSPAASSS
ncbi:MAG TPA: TCR/Tet family MFS transporter [Myxococcales bacterium]|nr:TCR/Tet family MFS transporter [Myxococcales bacterium]